MNVFVSRVMALKLKLKETSDHTIFLNSIRAFSSYWMAFLTSSPKVCE